MWGQDGRKTCRLFEKLLIVYREEKHRRVCFNVDGPAHNEDKHMNSFPI